MDRRSNQKLAKLDIPCFPLGASSVFMQNDYYTLGPMNVETGLKHIPYRNHTFSKENARKYHRIIIRIDSTTGLCHNEKKRL